jgi:hypothetical protein
LWALPIRPHLRSRNPFWLRRRNANPFGVDTNLAKQIGVQAGQQYVKVDSTRNPPPVWEVMSIYSGVGSIVHAGLMNPEVPMDRKTVSISALLDKKRYRVLRDVGADPVEQDTSRGAMKTKAEPMLPSSKPASVFSGFLNTWFALISYRRATCETDTPRTRVCAQIIRFSSSLQFRRLLRFTTKRSPKCPFNQ